MYGKSSQRTNNHNYSVKPTNALINFATAVFLNGGE